MLTKIRVRVLRVRVLRIFARQDHIFQSPLAGLSLIDLLIASALIGIIAIGISRMQTNMMNGQVHLSLSSDQLAIKNTLSKTLDCGETFSHNAADSIDLLTSSNANINVYRSDGSLLISKDSNNPTRIGRWTLRAYPQNASNLPGQPDNYGIHIEVARPLASHSNILNSTNPAEFAKDPLNNRILLWGASQSFLFAPSAQPCQSIFTGGSSGSTNQVTTPLTVSPLNNGTLTPEVVGDPHVCQALGGAAGVSRIHYYGTISCAQGYTAIGGGADCEGGAGGTTAVSRPVLGAIHQWFIDCCVYQTSNTPQLINGYVNCIKNPN